jgi:hypothetical protein
MGSGIRYLKQEEVDTVRWDACIDAAPNGRIYAYSYYLNEMADHWDALVLGNYEAVFPLPWRKKWGIRYLYQPPFTAQLGLFGTDVAVQQTAWLQAIPSSFKFGDLPLNQHHVPADGAFSLYPRRNFVLSLDAPYEALRNGFRENNRRNARKALGMGCFATPDLEVEEVISLAAAQPQQRTTAAEDFNRFRRIYRTLGERGQTALWGVRSARGELLASCVLLFANGRAYYILVGNHPNGRTLGASHLLIDALVQAHAGQPLLLDFEGSDLGNLAFFYAGFGATEEIYPQLRLNRLPWWAAWAKR